MNNIINNLILCKKINEYNEMFTLNMEELLFANYLYYYDLDDTIKYIPEIKF
jgi:hypothetical protein